MEKNRDGDRFKWSIKPINRIQSKDEKKRMNSVKRYNENQPYNNNQKQNKKRAFSSQITFRKAHAKAN